MPITLSGTYISTIDLTNAASQNPVTVTGLIDINSQTVGAVGILGEAGYAWTLGNVGTIASTGNSGVGVRFQSGGKVLNGQSDSITGLIVGASQGVYISGSAGTVVNYGTIAGTDALSQGIYLANGGIIANDSSGLITGRVIGISLGYGPNIVHNSGTIEARGVRIPGYGVLGVGILATTDGTIVNSNNGLVIGALDGIAFAESSNSTGSLFINDGTIEGTGFVGNQATYGAGIQVLANATAINGSLGIIDGLTDGIRNFGGTVANSGTIAGMGTSSEGIYLTQGGNVTNYSSGLVVGASSGIDIKQQGVGTNSATVNNYGTVVAGTNGVGIDLTNGDVTNHGTIIAPGSAGKAVIVHYGTFFNDGVVVGSVYGIELGIGGSSGGGVRVTASGTVSGAIGIGAAQGVTAGYTVTVAGAVVGNSGTAVSLTPNAANRLVLQPGALFAGIVDGGGGASVLEVAVAGVLAAAAAGGVAYISLDSIVNFSSLQIDPGAAAAAAGGIEFDTLVN